MIRNLFKTSRRLIALTLVFVSSTVPALAGLTITGGNGITVSGADGVGYVGTNGITVSGADNVLAFNPNGITASGADGITPSGADGITVSGADGITASGADSTTIARADGITASGADGITISGADGSTYRADSIIIRNPTGITVSGADNVVATGVNGITASGADTRNIDHADGITASGADGTLKINGADGITATGADGVVFSITPSAVTITGLNGITASGADGITISGADNVVATGVNGITASGADTRNIDHADGITASGADGTLKINGADGITATGADGVVFSITPSAVTITGLNGITASGADGITISGADSFVETGADAITKAMTAAENQTGLVSFDPELAVLLNRMTDDSNVDAAIIYHHTPTDTDIANLQSAGILGGTRYRVLPIVSVTATKAQLSAVSHLPAVRSIYGNRTLQWNLQPAARSLTEVDLVRRNNDLTRANRGLPVSGRGVTVAVLDTGVDGTHADLSGRVIQNIKLADTQSLGAGFNYPVAAPTLPNTDQAYGHGTFVAGVIAGNGQQSGGKYAGVAPNANIVGLSAGDASLFFVLSGLDYLLGNAASLNVRVVNCSFSANTVFDVNDPVNIATKMLADNGINVVFSAGNNGSGSDSLNPYSVAPWVISTGATDDQGKLASFSSRGEFGSPLFRPTLVAPGVNTVSLRASTIAAVTSIDGLLANDAQLSSSELPYYTSGSGTSFSAPQVAGVIALMLEANPQLGPAQIRDILQRTATPLPPYYPYEVGAGMLNAQAAVLEAAFSQRRFGQWRGIAYQNQVQFVGSGPQQFNGSVTSGGSNDSALAIPAGALLASVQIAWGDLLNPTNLSLTMIDPAGNSQPTAAALNGPGLTGRRQRVTLQTPQNGTWKARAHNLTSVNTSSSSSPQLVGMTSTQTGAQSYTGVLQYTTARYPMLGDLATINSSAVLEIYQNFRALALAPVGGNFRPAFGVTRSALAGAMVLGGRVPQYLPAQTNYPDVTDKATMLFVESAQASPNGALFAAVTPGTNFQPDAIVDRLSAVIALVRAAGLRQQAESGTYTLTCTDAALIPASLRGYVAVAVQNGLIQMNGTAFNPQAAFTRLDLSHALARMAASATQ